MKVKVKRLSPKAKLPSLATVGSGCYDVCAAESTYIWPDGNGKVGTGLAFEIPMGYLLEIRPRSGLAEKGLIIPNSPGTLDSDYRGELKILLRNMGDIRLGVRQGDKIAQVRIVPLIFPYWKEVEELGSTERGSKGFGSTGR